MGRKGRIYGIILTSTAMAGCMETEVMQDTEVINVTVSAVCPGFRTRAVIPEEDRINDINIIIFEDGKAETLFWQEDLAESDAAGFETSLVKGRKYSILAAANLGERLEIGTLEEIEDVVAEVSEEGFRNACIPMSVFEEDVSIDEDGRIILELVRLAAKVSIRMDRSRLSKDVDMTVKSVRIGNFPKYVCLAGPSKVASVHDRYDTGFRLTTQQCESLNRSGIGGISSEVSLFMLENMQGDFPYDISDDEEKILDPEDPLYDRASYLEIEIGYKSSELVSYDSNLIYRFYLGGSRHDLDMERNSHYHILVSPEDDGLSGGGWRVDKSGIGPSVPVFNMYPGEIVTGEVGDTVRVWCECYPRTSPFDPGYEELNFDKERGIYDYTVDEDRHGVTLYLKKPGTGIVYMSAGEPINKEGMVIVVVKP
ncbi:MAG: DUF4906 domain-containing protein [Bacteroidales bacterium]|nr:DUF4906 domain-containing protein [Bacteroidales bacterium]